MVFLFGLVSFPMLFVAYSAVLEVGVAMNKWEVNDALNNPQLIRFEKLLKSKYVAASYAILVVVIVGSIAYEVWTNYQGTTQRVLYFVGYTSFAIFGVVMGGFILLLFVGIALVPCYLVLAALILLISTTIRLAAIVGKWSIDICATAVTNLLERKPLADTLLILSGVFFIIGSLMELAAS